LGAASADTVFAIISGFGLTIISDFIASQQTYLRICGSIILFYLGIKIFMTNPGIQIRKQSKEKNFLKDYISTFFLTISNPITLFVFAAVFAGFGIVKGESALSSITELVFGVLLGASIWWSILTTIINLFRSKIRLRRLLWINKISGILIMLFGTVALISLFYI
jgi:threonine/homoserine/homoserine lactone efflux protein